jgi:3-hydroxyacyl-[acyl-carrier-protein] dehydratase
MTTAGDGTGAFGAEGVVLSQCRRMPDGSILSRVRVASGSQWYDGHFPGEPILPGVAQLGLVFDTLQSVTDRPVRLAGVRRVRFKRIVGPHDDLTIVVHPPSRGANGYAFRIFVDDVVVCSGTLDVL